jgi:hypothetical protein
VQAAVEALDQQLSLVGQPHNFLIKQLAAAEATAAAAQAELAAAKVSSCCAVWGEGASMLWRACLVAKH